MLIDFRTAATGTEIEADLCVIGAGAAGITIAREFAGKSIRVCLIESGGFDFDDETQALCQGEAVGTRAPREPTEPARRSRFDPKRGSRLRAIC